MYRVPIYLKHRTSFWLCTPHNKISFFSIVPAKDRKTALLKQKQNNWTDEQHDHVRDLLANKRIYRL